MENEIIVLDLGLSLGGELDTVCSATDTNYVCGIDYQCVTNNCTQPPVKPK